jgi:hypothetical protein
MRLRCRATIETLDAGQPDEAVGRRRGRRSAEPLQIAAAG